MKKKFGFVPGGRNLAWLRTEKKRQRQLRPVKTTIVESRSIIEKDFGNRGSGGICEAGFPGQRTVIQLPVKDRK